MYIHITCAPRAHSTDLPARWQPQLNAGHSTASAEKSLYKDLLKSSQEGEKHFSSPGARCLRHCKGCLAPRSTNTASQHIELIPTAPKELNPKPPSPRGFFPKFSPSTLTSSSCS